MKNVLLLVHHDSGQEARLQSALDLTRALRGHLICLAVSDAPVISDDFYATPAEEKMCSEARAREDANRDRLKSRLSREGVQWTWLDQVGSITPSLLDAARMADLVVVNRQLDAPPGPDMRGIASQVLIGSGRAVIAVPADAKGFDTAGLAMIAWDGSAEAMNAVQAVVPLLQLAGAVTLVEVADDVVETPAEEAAAYLSRHGVKPVVVRRRNRGIPTSWTLLFEAEREGADYLVMGGFGHSRFAEALFGGVSRDVLSESPIPAVMTH